MNPPRPHRHLALASSSWTVLDPNVVPTEEPIEMDPPAAPALQHMRPLKLETTTTVQRIFRDFTLRRAALISAITTDEEELFRKCDPNLDPVHLYGHTDGSWEVRKLEPPSQTPGLSINLMRNNMEHVQWLRQIAKHCDTWLINVSFFDAAKLLNVDGRELLLNSINSLPTVHEEFVNSEAYHHLCCEKEERSRAPDNEVEDEHTVDYEVLKNNDDKKDFRNEDYLEEAKDGPEEAKEDEDVTFCGCCGDRYRKKAFWIGCDACKGWFHGKCVKITQDLAKHMKHYVCPDCRFDENGHDYD